MIRALGDWQWRAEDRLGGGGYASVYRGRGEGLDDCAVKVYDNPHYANTFEREVAALRSLEGCRSVVRLYDYGRDAEGRLCVVTERVAGERLDQHIRRHGPLDPARVEQLLRGLLKLLGQVHGRGWLHKDIKASNILVDGDRFTLLDWGVAARRGDGRYETIRAKREFVAPECYYGRHDYATDLYSLAWLGVYAATGALPYRFAEVHDADYRVAAHCMERPALPSGVPPQLRNLLLGWLAKRPEARPVGYDLDELLVQLPREEPAYFDDLEFCQLQFECGWLHRAARHGVPYAQLHYANRLFDAGRLREARYWLERAWSAGYAQAGYRLARRLAEGDEKAGQRAERVLRRAAQMGHGAARYRLGRALLDTAPEEAEQWLRLAADDGERRAHYALYRLLAKRPGAEEEAARYRSLAADRGDPRLSSTGDR